ncbi:MAG: transglutaminase-like domain-containing protein [Alkalibacterium sp.]|nr:transglutaminase-like domain-containing protein [Alkalibacterium sp.]
MKTAQRQRSIPSSYTFRKNDTLNVDLISDTPDPVDSSSETLSEARLEWFDELTYIAYPYGLRELELDETEADLSLKINETSSYLTVQSETDGPDGYTLTYDRTFPDRLEEEALRLDDGWRETLIATYREETAELESADEIEDDDLFYQWFEQELQLPTALPQRVTELAEEITAGLETEYDMVRAVESYLKEEGGYRYSLLDSEDTPQGADYVDHFLFRIPSRLLRQLFNSHDGPAPYTGHTGQMDARVYPGSQIVTEGEDVLLSSLIIPMPIPGRKFFSQVTAGFPSSRVPLLPVRSPTTSPLKPYGAKHTPLTIKIHWKSMRRKEKTQTVTNPTH